MDDSLEFQTHVVTGHRPGPRLLITAGIHGDEFEPMAAVQRLKRMITPNDLTGTLCLIPVVNLRAFVRASRCNEDGLDLARTCPGKPTGSPTERIAAQLSTLIRKATHYIDLHTGGTQLSLVPLCGYMLHQDEIVLAMQRQMARAFGLPYIWGTTSELEGRTLSVARDAKIPAVYVEHGGGVTFRPDAVDDIVSGCLNVMQSLGMLPGEFKAAPVKAFIEEMTLASGHLQIQNRAPMDGLFQSTVKLGDTLAEGDEIGKIESMQSGERVAVRASNDGIVFMLRLIASVRKGDALAAIIQVENSND